MRTSVSCVECEGEKKAMRMMMKVVHDNDKGVSEGGWKWSMVTMTTANDDRLGIKKKDNQQRRSRISERRASDEWRKKMQTCDCGTRNIDEREDDERRGRRRRRGREGGDNKKDG
jgi:hypothetical protein